MVPERYDCTYGEQDNMACSQNGNIPCWVSRPKEKEVMMWYMLTMTLVSTALVCGEFFYVTTKITVKVGVNPWWCENCAFWPITALAYRLVQATEISALFSLKSQVCLIWPNFSKISGCLIRTKHCSMDWKLRENRRVIYDLKPIRAKPS